jgi:hypothetical protein
VQQLPAAGAAGRQKKEAVGGGATIINIYFVTTCPSPPFFLSLCKTNLSSHGSLQYSLSLSLVSMKTAPIFIPFFRAGRKNKTANALPKKR